MTDRLTKLVETRMASGDSFTFAELCQLDPDKKTFRLADRTIQKWRRKGWIAFTRSGRLTVWRLTEAGIAAVNSTQQQELNEPG